MIIADHCKPGEWRNRDGWYPKFNWSDGTYVQWGTSQPREDRDTFFEVFPDNPSTIIHCKGKTLEEAEIKAWKLYQNYLNCPNHQFEKRDYRNGAGVCKHCNLFKSSVFEPSEICCQCGINCYFGQDNTGNWWCENCATHMPRELWPQWKKWAEEEKNVEFTPEEIEQGIKEVCDHIISLGR